MSVGAPESGESSLYARTLAGSRRRPRARSEGAEPDGKRLFRGALTLFVMRISSRFLAFPTTLVLARTLGPAEYGKYAYGVAWSTLLGTPAVLGLNRYLVRGVAHLRATEDWGLMRGLLSWSARTVASVSVGAAVVGAAVAPFVIPSEFRVSFWLALALVPIVALTNLRQAILQGLHHVEVSFVPEQIVYPALFLAVIVAVRFGHPFHISAPVALMLNIATSLVAFALGVQLVRTRLPRTLRASRRELARRDWIKTALPFTVIGLATVANSQIGIVLLGSLAPAKSVGVYQVASRLADLVAFALAAATAHISPMASRLRALDRLNELQPLVSKSCRTAILFSGPLVFAMIVFRGPVMQIFGHAYHGGSTPLMILALGQLISAMAGPIGSIMLMTGGERVAATTFIGSCAVNIALAAVLIPHFGPSGAAIGRACGMAFWNIGLWFLTLRKLGINSSILPTRLVRRLA
jgi:O-antigen/teichoic acid export membrane protein